MDYGLKRGGPEWIKYTSHEGRDQPYRGLSLFLGGGTGLQLVQDL